MNSLGTYVCEYRRPTFNCVVKRLRFRIFKEIVRIQLLCFGPAWTHPHVRKSETYFAFLIIANWGKFAFTFIASLHLNVALR